MLAKVLTVDIDEGCSVFVISLVVETGGVLVVDPGEGFSAL